jgi:Flp pilus assembly protein TadG
MHARCGTAAVEAAIILPLLIITSIGGVDVAQYINLGQVVSNASREAASVASRNSTSSVEEVQEAVENYFKNWFPADEATGFGNALTVTITREDSASIPSGDLTRIESGEFLQVDVSFDFSSIRWFHGPNYWNDNVQITTTHCRRY